jgi:hypothetical protein
VINPWANPNTLSPMSSGLWLCGEPATVIACVCVFGKVYDKVYLERARKSLNIHVVCPLN